MFLLLDLVYMIMHSTQDNKGLIFQINCRGLGGVAFSARLQPLNFGPDTSCWKVGSYLLMPGDLQCRILTN